ncbi:MAG TPA: hypothetical protein VJ112_04695, partial [Rhabdochlamydiaceae bacterium]|nr:hypothetical protein [Rhabdochlamydiaceae bacterium]
MIKKIEGIANPSIILKTAVEAGKKAQSFDPEPLDAGVAFTFWGVYSQTVVRRNRRKKTALRDRNISH